MEIILRYLFFFEFFVGLVTVVGIALTTVLERLQHLPDWALRVRGVLTSIF